MKQDEEMKAFKNTSLHPSPLAGLKRKAEDSDSDYGSRSRSASASGLVGDMSSVSVKVEETDSPRPLKKLALTPA